RAYCAHLPPQRLLVLPNFLSHGNIQPSPPMIIQSLPFAFLLGDATPMDLFIKGKEIMWPILLLSFVAITVVIERLLFIIRENASREPEVVEKMLEAVERRDID